MSSEFSNFVAVLPGRTVPVAPVLTCVPTVKRNSVQLGFGPGPVAWIHPVASIRWFPPIDGNGAEQDGMLTNAELVCPQLWPIAPMAVNPVVLDIVDRS